MSLHGIQKTPIPRLPKTPLRAAPAASLSEKSKSVEALSIALEKSVVYSYHLLNEFAPEIVRRNAAHNALAMQNGEYHSVILPDLQIVLARLRKLLHDRR
jgi:hypothetical protein